MSERGEGARMVSDQDIAEALESLLRESNPNNNPLNFNGIVQQLESKLGLNLSHKVDFISNQIHFLFPLPPQQQLPFHHHRPQPEHFALHQNPNFHPVSSSQFPPNFAAHRPEDFVFRQAPPSALPVTKTEAGLADVATAVSQTPAPEASKDSAQPAKKKRGGPGGLNKLCGVSPELQAVVGHPQLPRTEIVKQLWAYIRKNNLQDPSNKRKIICNDELRLVFETDCTDMFKMNKLLAKHIIPLEPTKPTSRNSKKPKVDKESSAMTASRSIESVPLVIISEALANFFAISEREMSQAEVLRRVWEYIKVNQLEVLNDLPSIVLMDILRTCEFSSDSKDQRRSFRSSATLFPPRQFSCRKTQLYLISCKRNLTNIKVDGASSDVKTANIRIKDLYLYFQQVISEAQTYEN